MSLPFDPRLAALVPAAFELPPVTAVHLSPSALRTRFATPPSWQADVEVEHWFSKKGEPVSAAVLVPLVVRADRPYAPTVLFTQRTGHLKAHAGQISFPGGRTEKSDADAVATALREAHEEVGLPPDRVEVIGQLPSYVTGTGFVVTPVVGLIHVLAHESGTLGLTPDPNEVAEIFEVPLDFLMNPANHQRRAVSLAGADLGFFAMPWRQPDREDDYFIWGATAAMLRNLYRFLAA